MASGHCWRTSDSLSYWPGLASGISTVAENLKKNNDVTENLNEEDVDVRIHPIILQQRIKIENI